MALYFNSGLLTIHSQYHRLSLFLYTVVVVNRDIDRNTRIWSSGVFEDSFYQNID